VSSSVFAVINPQGRSRCECRLCWSALKRLADLAPLPARRRLMQPQLPSHQLLLRCCGLAELEATSPVGIDRHADQGPAGAIQIQAIETHQVRALVAMFRSSLKNQPRSRLLLTASAYDMLIGGNCVSSGGRGACFRCCSLSGLLRQRPFGYAAVQLARHAIVSTGLSRLPNRIRL
jgi:hypothetical protein